MLAAILLWGLLTLWIPGRWALSAFQVALFALAAVHVIRRWRDIRLHPVAILLTLAALWCALQLVAGWTVESARTVDAALNWTTSLSAFCIALDSRSPSREQLLNVILWFAAVLSVVAIFTQLTSPPGYVFWVFDTGSELPTLGPFVYRNQYAAFVEAVLPLAILRAILDRRRWMQYTIVSAALFGSVVAGGSRAGTILCMAEILLVPALVFVRGLIPGRVLARAWIGCVLTAAVLTGVVGWQPIWNRLQEPNPYSMRRELVSSSLEMLRDRPWTGFGLGTWSTAYPGYAHFDDGRFVNQAHNDWVQWAAEGGVPFLLLMLAIPAFSARPAYRTIWGIGPLIVFVHCLVDYPMQQRPALAAFFFALLGTAFAYDNGPDEPTRIHAVRFD